MRAIRRYVAHRQVAGCSLGRSGQQVLRRWSFHLTEATSGSGFLQLDPRQASSCQMRDPEGHSGRRLLVSVGG